MVTLTQDLLALVFMALGALVQSTIGFGAGLLAVPLLLIVEPGLVPTPLLIASLVLTGLMIRRDGGTHHWQTVRWPIIGSVPGTVLGAAAIAIVDRDKLTIFFGIVVIAAVALSASGLHPPRTNRNLAVAGTLSGFMGTAAGIGGPPIALLYQHAPGPEIRAALSRFFGVGSILSLLVLAVVGQVHGDDIGRALVLTAGVLIGHTLSGRLAHHIHPQLLRPLVLVISAASALVAIARVLL